MWRSLPEGNKTITRSLLALTVLLLLVGTACLVVGLQEHRHPLAGPVRQHRTVTARAATATAPEITVPAPAVVARSVPVAVRIPAIGLAV
jgi:hypothetical protein